MTQQNEINAILVQLSAANSDYAACRAAGDKHGARAAAERAARLRREGLGLL